MRRTSHHPVLYFALLLIALQSIAIAQDPPAATADEPLGDYLLAPEIILDGEEPIEVTVGHAHPVVVDWDGDGVLDLLVGQFGAGALRVYPNVGSAEAPAFEGYSLAQAGGRDARVLCG